MLPSWAALVADPIEVVGDRADPRSRARSPGHDTKVAAPSRNGKPVNLKGRYKAANIRP
jgi:hypothetical protein